MFAVRKYQKVEQLCNCTLVVYFRIHLLEFEFDGILGCILSQHQSNYQMEIFENDQITFLLKNTFITSKGLLTSSQVHTNL